MALATTGYHPTDSVKTIEVGDDSFTITSHGGALVFKNGRLTRTGNPAAFELLGNVLEFELYDAKLKFSYSPPDKALVLHCSRLPLGMRIIAGITPEMAKSQ